MVRKQHNAHRAAELVLELLKSLAQAVRLVALYKASHPVPAAALRECEALIETLLKASRHREVALALVEGRWVCDDAPVTGNPSGVEGLAEAFRAQGVFSAAFHAGVRAADLAAFCAVLASQTQVAEPMEELRRSDARHIRLNGERYSRAEAPAAKPETRRPVESPIAAARRSQPASKSGLPEKLSGLPFGSFIKTLVDESVEDPAARAQIYSDVLSMVKQALERRAAESTKAIQAERRRMERLMSTVAEGRVVVDRDGRVLMMDPIAEEIAGKPLAELAGKPILENAGSDHIVAFAEGADAVQVAGDDELVDAMRQATAVVQDEEGRVVGTYGVMPYVAKLRDAMKAKDEFISHVTHELKAPLASISSALELMAGSKARMSPQDARFLDICTKNTRQLSQMINEVLDFSRLQSGRMSVMPVVMPLGPALTEAVEGLRPWALTKGLTLLFRGEAAFTVVADHNRVVQVLNNLISNGIKATPEGGCIEVSAEVGTGRDAGCVVVRVKDTGCGIAADKHAAIFQRFNQAMAPGQKREGVGLGLAIVRDLVMRNGGRVWVESEQGRGAAFYFTLPLATR